MDSTERIALFAGSFDPFTVGHKSIVDRALPMFDRIIIGLGVNFSKTPWSLLEERLGQIRSIYASDPRVEAVSFSGLATEFARSRGVRFMLRGVRTVADFEYERNLADANRLLEPAIETVLLPALPDLAVISSSLVRELARFGAPYEQFLP